MARAKKPRYEYIESKQLYRKRLKGRDGKTVALYGKTPQELSIKIEEFQEDLLNYQDNRENPYVGDYADYWLDLQEGHLTYGAYTDYQSVINRHIKPPMEGLRMRDVRPDDINRMMKRVTSYHRSSDPRYRSGRWSRHLGCHQPAGRLRQRQPRCECSCTIK